VKDERGYIKEWRTQEDCIRAFRSFEPLLRSFPTTMDWLASFYRHGYTYLEHNFPRSEKDRHLERATIRAIHIKMCLENRKLEPKKRVNFDYALKEGLNKKVIKDEDLQKLLKRGESTELLRKLVKASEKDLVSSWIRKYSQKKAQKWLFSVGRYQNSDYSAGQTSYLPPNRHMPTDWWSLCAADNYLDEHDLNLFVHFVRVTKRQPCDQTPVEPVLISHVPSENLVAQGNKQGSKGDTFEVTIKLEGESKEFKFYNECDRFGVKEWNYSWNSRTYFWIATEKTGSRSTVPDDKESENESQMRRGSLWIYELYVSGFNPRTGTRFGPRPVRKHKALRNELEKKKKSYQVQPKVAIQAQ